MGVTVTAELDTQDPRVTASLKLLGTRLSNFLYFPFDGRTVELMERIVQEHRAEFKRDHGYEFPPLVPFVLPSVKFIVFYRADLEDQAIHDKMLMLLRQFAERKAKVSEIELAFAIKSCWPHYRPPIETMRKNPRVGRVLQ